MDKIALHMTATWNVRQKRKPIYLSLKVMNNTLKIIVFSFYQLSRANCVVFRLTNILMNNKCEYEYSLTNISTIQFSLNFITSTKP